MKNRSIEKLPPILANQIAAGEVVDRPASIVKELVENSLDAGAKSIEIRIEEGGLKLIQVKDDGCGIREKELILAVSPHATSKIYSLDELENLQTLGFRGEALASIASVSRFLLKSCPINQDHGAEIEVSGDLKQVAIKPSSIREGSRVEVRDLFFNTPARRKFLKKEATEFSHIDEVLRKLAMSHSQVAFRLYHHEKLSWSVEAASNEATSQKRWASLVGPDFYEQSQKIEASRAGFHLEGLIIQPKFMKKNRGIQYFFLNGRPIRDKLIFHAIKEAYRDVSYGDHQAAYVLFLELDPKNVDFNVHPSKLEVRFREGRQVHDFILFEIKKTLGKQRVESISNFEIAENHFCQDKQDPMNGAALKQAFFEPNFRPKTGEEMRLSLDFHAQCDEKNQEAEEAPRPIKSAPRFGKALCQIHDTFILSEHSEGLMIIDMHAAHERILYEKLKAQWHREGLPKQNLLLPQTLLLTQKEWAIFKEYEALFPDLGLEIEEWVDFKILIRAVPVTLLQKDLTHFVQELLRDLDLLGHSLQKENYIDQILAELACHSAIQSGHRLSLMEMNQLLQDMENTPRIEYCNHGRPTSSLLKMVDLDRLFLRGR